MFTLPKSAKDDDLRDGVRQWFTHIANGEIAEAQEFLDTDDSPEAMSVTQFIERVADLTSGGKVTVPPKIEDLPDDFKVDDIPLEGPSDTVLRWIPGPNTTERYPGFVADILYTIPVNGDWSALDASFFVRAKNESWSLQLRDIVILED